MTPDRSWAWKLFAICWLVYTAYWAPYIVREHFPAITLAEQGTLNVERFLGWSEDVFPGPRGGAFINNNPGASLLGAVPLRLFRPVLGAIERWNQTLPPPVLAVPPESAVYRRAVAERREWYFLAVGFLTVAGLMAPLSALTAALLGLTLRSTGLGRGTAFSIALLYAFGTPVFFRTQYLNHNLLVGHAGLLALLLLWDKEGRPLSIWRTLAAGLLAGFSVLCDYTGLLVLGIVGIYVWLRATDGASRRLPVLATYLGAAAPSLVVLLAYQQLSFGHAALPSQHFMPATAPTTQGYRGIDWPSLELLWMNFFDPRFGLFVYCPLLALGLAAPFAGRASVQMPRREMFLALGFVWVFVGFCAANQYSRLQYTTGVRYLVPAVPALLLLSVQVLQVLPTGLRRVLVGWTIAQGWLLAITHERLAFSFVTGLREGVQLPWARRMHELGLLGSPALVSSIIIATTLGGVYLLWRREGACGS